MRSAALAFLVLSASIASAQAPKIETPFRLELGAFFPNYRGADFGSDLGVAGSFGYDVWRKDALTLGASLRGAYHLATLGGGGDSNPNGAAENDITVSSIFVDARYQRSKNPLFAGVGIGFGQVSVRDSRNHSGLLLAVESGINLSSHVYVALRYQHAGPDALRGATASLGFRF